MFDAIAESLDNMNASEILAKNSGDATVMILAQERFGMFTV